MELSSVNAVVAAAIDTCMQGYIIALWSAEFFKCDFLCWCDDRKEVETEVGFVN